MLLVLPNRATGLAPGSAIPYANRGRALTELGRLDEAIAAYSQALGLDPGMGDVRNGLAFVLRCASRLKEAEQQARAAIQQAPRDENPGCVLCDLERPREVVCCFDLRVTVPL